MGFLPPGTTWLDVATLAIAVGAFALAFWRYRRESKVGVRVESAIVQPGNDGVIAVVVTNTERRTVPVDRAGLTTRKDFDGQVFEQWHSVNLRHSASGLPLGDFPLPKTLDSGGPYGVRAGVRVGSITGLWQSRPSGSRQGRL
jgi:hypothetical protein